MKNLFNRTFYKFTLGFIGILLGSFALAAIVNYIDAAQTMPAQVSSGR